MCINAAALGTFRFESSRVLLESADTAPSRKSRIRSNLLGSA